MVMAPADRQAQAMHAAEQKKAAEEAAAAETEPEPTAEA